MRTLIKKLGTFISSRRTLNFIEGTNVTMTVNDNASTNTVDITINSSGGGGGSITGSGTANELTYWTSSSALSSLATSTYPSLTELSYVKGLTSAVQTQIGNKQDSLVSGTNIKSVTGLSLLGSGDIYPAHTSAVTFVTVETAISSAAYTDITGASVSLSAGTWIIFANVITRNVNVAVLVHAAITDSSNVVIAEASQGGASSGSATVGQFVNLNITGVVTPTTTTTYKLRAARGNTTITGSFTVMDGAGVGTTNNVSDNSNKGTSIIALRIA
jgi:hypothetical protein